jgi:DNA-binding HxlR family transcriptional regulator
MDPRNEPRGTPAGGDSPATRGGNPPALAGGDELDLLGRALGVVGDRWTLVVIASLLDGPQRYGDLQERVAGIAPNILAARLKRLEEAGVITARAYQERPPRYLYELAAGGSELAGAVRLLAEWGARHTEAEPPRHAACGTPLETRWWCPACAEAVDAPAVDDGVYLA